MRVLQILGGILIAGGLFVLIKAPSYSSEKSVFKIGDVEARVAQEHPVPPWAGGAAVAAGVVLIVVGARKRCLSRRPKGRKNHCRCSRWERHGR